MYGFDKIDGGMGLVGDVTLVKGVGVLGGGVNLYYGKERKVYSWINWREGENRVKRDVW